MKNVLTVAAIAVTLLAPSFFGKATAGADPIVVGQTPISSSDQVSPLLGAMTTMHTEMAAIKLSSATTDKDYKNMMRVLSTTMKTATRAEMKSGKNPQMVETAQQVYNRLFKSDPIDGIFGINQ
jgi:hypothetical protein